MHGIGQWKQSALAAPRSVRRLVLGRMPGCLQGLGRWLLPGLALLAVALSAHASDVCSCGDAAQKPLAPPADGDAVQSRAAALSGGDAAQSLTPAPLVTSAAPSAATSPAPRPPITLVIPYNPGSGPDQVARAIARVWSELLHEPVVVKHVAERQGQIAARWVASAPPDGRLLLLTTSSLLDRPLRRRGPDDLQAEPLQVRSFTPLMRVGDLPFAVIIKDGMVTAQMPAPAPLLDAPGQAAVTAALERIHGRAKPSPRNEPPTYFPSPTAPRLPASPMPVLDDSPLVPWNALLAPPQLPAALATRLRSELGDVLTDPRVRLTMAQAGSEFWYEIPEEAPVTTTPLPLRRTIP